MTNLIEEVDVEVDGCGDSIVTTSNENGGINNNSSSINGIGESCKMNRSIIYCCDVTSSLQNNNNNNNISNISNNDTNNNNNNKNDSDENPNEGHRKVTTEGGDGKTSMIIKSGKFGKNERNFEEISHATFKIYN